MARYIKQLTATNVHGQHDYLINFNEGINVLFGENGSGKTTILHILANAIQCDFHRFVSIQFDTIEVLFDDNTHLKVSQTNRKKRGRNIIHYHGDIVAHINDEIIFDKTNICERNLPSKQSDKYIENTNRPLMVDYFPAFRLIIDAFDNVTIERKRTMSDFTELLLEQREHGNDSNQQESNQSRIVLGVREVLGEFVPFFDFPPASSVEGLLNKLLSAALTQVNAVDREQFLKFFSYADSIDYTDKQIDEIRSEVEKLLKEYRKYPIHLEQDWEQLEEQLLHSSDSTSPQTKLLLPAFHRALSTVVEKQQSYLATFDQQIDTINQFLVRKRLDVGENKDGDVHVQLNIDELDEPVSDFYHTLSSGEKHILALVYAATKANDSDVILIDEPEISLHTNWQRKLLRTIQEQTEDNKQVIVCTHSAAIASHHIDQSTVIRFKESVHEGE